MTTPRTQHKIVLADETATVRLAGRVAEGAVPGDVIALSGVLGSGKTVFARAFIKARSTGAEEVPSPTFTLVQEYEFPPDGDGGGDTIQVYHFDLFRIEDADETMELGMEDAFAGGISLIEWPERVQDLLPEDRLEITLTQGDDAGSRKAVLLGFGSWQPRLEELAPGDIEGDIEGVAGD